MNDFWDSLDALEEFARDRLFDISGEIKDDELSSLVFGIGIIISDYAFGVLRKLVSE